MKLPSPMQFTFKALSLNEGTCLYFFHKYVGVIKSERNEIGMKLGRRKQWMYDYLKKPLED
jgi:hypothetical protein